jgi:hypothetical protein
MGYSFAQNNHAETSVISLVETWHKGGEAVSEQTIVLFRPSNGTQGESFIAGWCGRCKRDRVMNGEVEADTASEQDCCPDHRRNLRIRRHPSGISERVALRR